LALAGASPLRCSSCRPCLRKRLPRRSSPGFRSSCTVLPEVPAHGLSTEGTSPGVRCPYSARGGGSPRLAGCPVKLPRGSPGDCAGGSHSADYGAAHRLSQPLSGFLFPPPSCHFQAGGALGVLPSRGLFRPRSPDSSSPPACPPDVPPGGCAFPRPGEGNRQARWPFPRIERSHVFGRLQGLCLRGSRSVPREHG
jgi:hypothetical protein